MYHHPYTHFIATGACYIDTILTLPTFPSEDTKQRATTTTRRRGGNCANTLEVLQQLLSLDVSSPPPSLHLLTTLPDQSTADAQFIQTSLNTNGIDTSHSVHRPTWPTAPASTVIRTSDTGTRTIITHPLPSPTETNLTPREFQTSVSQILPPAATGRVWFHFETRAPSTVLEHIVWLRQLPDLRPTISVELENTRVTDDEMDMLARVADVVFYSSAVARRRGFDGVEGFLAKEVGRFSLWSGGKVVCCTFGDAGAGMVDTRLAPGEVYTRPVWVGEADEEVKDTLGAGDTWIAAVVFGSMVRPRWDLGRRLEFANEVAGRKVRRDGFRGLDGEMRGRVA